MSAGETDGIGDFFIEGLIFCNLDVFITTFGCEVFYGSKYVGFLMVSFLIIVKFIIF